MRSSAAAAILPSQRGEAAELRALAYLQQQGCRLRQRNFRGRGGEIDLVMEWEGVLLFIEVRYRHDGRFGGAVSSVTAAKQQRLIQTAALYLQRYALDLPCRFDVVAMDDQQLNWIQHAFDAF